MGKFIDEVEMVNCTPLQKENSTQYHRKNRDIFGSCAK
jgi:hypothetical protein